MLSEAQMADIKKRLAERKKEWKKQISSVLDKDKYSWGHRAIVPNKDAQDKKAMERKILDPINKVRPKNEKRRRPREMRACKTIHKINRPTWVREV